MSPDKIREVVAIYRKRLQTVEPIQAPGDRNPAPQEAYSHLHWMLDGIEKFVAEGEFGKAYRWLGFVQGTFWAYGMYSIDQMREHNRG